MQKEKRQKKNKTLVSTLVYYLEDKLCLTNPRSFLPFSQANDQDLSNDADPKFLTEFYRNLKILNQDLFKKSSTGGSIGYGAGVPNAHASAMNKPSVHKAASLLLKKRGSFRGRDATEVTDATAIAQSQSAVIIGEPSTAGDASAMMKSQSSEMFTAPANYFSVESMENRMKIYADQQGVSIPMEYFEKYKALQPGSGGDQAVDVKEKEEGKDGADA